MITMWLITLAYPVATPFTARLEFFASTHRTPLAWLVPLILSVLFLSAQTAISAISAQKHVKKTRQWIRTIRYLRTYFLQLLSFIINNLKNKKPYPTDFPRTHSRTFSKVRRNPFLVPFSRRDNCSYSEWLKKLLPWVRGGARRAEGYI